MGSQTLRVLSERFIKEFGDDILKRHGLDALNEICTRALVFEEESKVVRIFYTLKVGELRRDVMSPEVYFDPTCDDEDLIENLGFILLAKKDVIIARLKKAELISNW